MLGEAIGIQETIFELKIGAIMDKFNTIKTIKIG